MTTSADAAAWQWFTDAQGHFRVEMPADWQAKQHDGPFTFSQPGHIWEAHRFFTDLTPMVEPPDVWHIYVSFRVEQFDKAPPDIFRGLPEATDVGYFRRYRISDVGDWLTCVVGHLRIHIQYNIHGWVRHYNPPPTPPELTDDQRRQRLATVQRIIDSFELLTPST